MDQFSTDKKSDEEIPLSAYEKFKEGLTDFNPAPSVKSSLDKPSSPAIPAGEEIPLSAYEKFKEGLTDFNPVAKAPGAAVPTGTAGVHPPEEETGWGEGIAKSLKNAGLAVGQTLGGITRWAEEASPRSLARTPFEIASIAGKIPEWAFEKAGAKDYTDPNEIKGSEEISKFGEKVTSFLSDKPMIKSAEEAAGMDQGLGERVGDYFSKKIQENAPYAKPGSFKSQVFGATQSLIGSLTAAATTLVTKNPELGLNLFLMQAAGQEYDEQRRAGTETARAAAAGLISGTAEKYTEKIPFDSFTHF